MRLWSDVGRAGVHHPGGTTELALWLRRHGSLVMTMSDKPDEATLPTPELAAKAVSRCTGSKPPPSASPSPHSWLRVLSEGGGSPRRHKEHKGLRDRKGLNPKTSVLPPSPTILPFVFFVPSW